MGLIPDELKTRQFRCPNCGQYVNTKAKVCRHCTTPLSSEDREAALATESEERRSASLTSHRSTLIRGAALLLGGLGNVLAPVFEFNFFFGQTRVPCLSTLAITFGSVVAAIGGSRYLREKNEGNV